jgi:site-specific DNA recombinase
LQPVLDDLRKRRVDGLVITKLDRLTRSLGDWANLIDELFSKHAGRRLFSVNDSIDTGTASGLLVLDVLMSVAQWERRIIA